MEKNIQVICDTNENVSGSKGWNIYIYIPLVVVVYLFEIISIESADLFLYRKAIRKQEDTVIKMLVEKDIQFL